MVLTLSVVVPVYSGERYLTSLVSEIEEVRLELAANGYPFQIAELLFVDDNSVDKSSSVIDQLAEQYDWITALHLSRNFGQHPATIAGILHSSGDWVVTMDEDLQHPPSGIVRLLKEVSGSGADLVYVRSDEGVHRNAFRDISSRATKAAIEFLSGNTAISKASSFRLIRGAIARGAASVCGHDTYLDVALTWFTQRVSVVKMKLTDQRFAATGKSGYSFRSLVSHGRRLIFSSQLKVLRLSIFVGMLTVLASLALAALVVSQKLIWPDSISIRGWPSLFIAILLMGGLTTFLLGVVLEYLSVLVLRAHGKPLFFLVDRSRDAELAQFFSESKE